MKHVWILSLATALCVVGCNNASLEKTARDQKNGLQKTGQQKPETPEENVAEEGSGTLIMPTNTNDRRMQVNGAATRNIIIGNVGFTTNVFCTENVLKAQKEKEKIKLQGQSQIIVRQVVTIVIPEVSSTRRKKKETEVVKESPKTLLSLACMGKSEDLTQASLDEDIIPTKLTPGKSATIVGRFSSVLNEGEMQTIVTCVTAKDMAKANSILLPEDDTMASDLLMATQSKMLVQTSSKDKDLKKYLLISCEEEATQSQQ